MQARADKALRARAIEAATAQERARQWRVARGEEAPGECMGCMGRMGRTGQPPLREGQAMASGAGGRAVGWVCIGCMSCMGCMGSMGGMGHLVLAVSGLALKVFYTSHFFCPPQETLFAQ